MSSLRVVDVYQPSGPDKEESFDHDDILDSRLVLPPQPQQDIATALSSSPRSPPGSDVLSPIASPEPSIMFDAIGEEQEQEEQEDEGVDTDATTMLRNTGPAERVYDELDDSYNLKPPPTVAAQSNSVETLSARFFSSAHLDIILRNPSSAPRFSNFISQYQPQYSDNVKHYAELRKAVAAVEYANTIAYHLPSSSTQNKQTAATLDPRFEEIVRQKGKELAEDALPAYLTHRLVLTITDTLVKEITGNSAPIMHELIPSLAEVYCISDPSLQDNPIVYASEEFYRTTQYGAEHVLGHNCRFLQGPRSSSRTVRRLIEALAGGEETCETILNYRRDGSPFLNLLMIAPLCDNKGHVRYFLGCQIDVTSLVENGRGLESFAQLLSQDRDTSRHGPLNRMPKEALKDVTQLFTDDESELVKAARSMSVRPKGSSLRGGRVMLGIEGSSEQKALWPHASLGRSGRLPGVYQNYLLVRPYPSLRITFTSAALRIPGILQTKLLDRIRGPPALLSGLEEALARGTGVTAKVTWLTSKPISDADGGKPRWLHCTPLFGSDDQVGVWMVVMVENEEVTGSINRVANTAPGGSSSNTRPSTGAGQYTASKLYADYLKREGKSPTRNTSSSTRETKETSEMRDVEEQFRNF